MHNPANVFWWFQIEEFLKYLVLNQAGFVLGLHKKYYQGKFGRPSYNHLNLGFYFQWVSSSLSQSCKETFVALRSSIFRVRGAQIKIPKAFKNLLLSQCWISKDQEPLYSMLRDASLIFSAFELKWIGVPAQWTHQLRTNVSWKDRQMLSPHFFKLERMF